MFFRVGAGSDSTARELVVSSRILESSILDTGAALVSGKLNLS